MRVGQETVNLLYVDLGVDKYNFVRISLKRGSEYVCLFSRRC